MVVDQGSFIDAAVVGFMMLEAEVRNVIAERVEKVIVAVVLRAEKLLGLLDQALVVIPDFLRGHRARRRCRRRCPSQVTADPCASGTIFRNSPVMTGRIDQHGEETGAKWISLPL